MTQSTAKPSGSTSHIIIITQPWEPSPITKTTHHRMAPDVRRLTIFPPRRRASPKLILIWMGTLVTLLLVIYYFTSRHPETAGRYSEHIKGGKGFGKGNHRFNA